MAKNPAPMTAPQPKVEIHAVSAPAPAPTERELQLEAEVARLRAELERLASAAKAAGLDAPSAEPGLGAGSPVTLIEYRAGTISETPATVIAQLPGGMLRVQPRGTRSTIDVAPHDGALGVKERVGYTGYTYADPLAEGLAQGLLP